MSTKRLLTTREMSEHFGISEATVRTWAKQGQLPEGSVLAIGKILRFDIEKIEQFAQGAYEGANTSPHDFKPQQRSTNERKANSKRGTSLAESKRADALTAQDPEPQARTEDKASNPISKNKQPGGSTNDQSQRDLVKESAAEPKESNQHVAPKVRSHIDDVTILDRLQSIIRNLEAAEKQIIICPANNEERKSIIRAIKLLSFTSGEMLNGFESASHTIRTALELTENHDVQEAVRDAHREIYESIIEPARTARDAVAHLSAVSGEILEEQPKRLGAALDSICASIKEAELLARSLENSKHKSSGQLEHEGGAAQTMHNALPRVHAQRDSQEDRKESFGKDFSRRRDSVHPPTQADQTGSDKIGRSDSSRCSKCGFPAFVKSARKKTCSPAPQTLELTYKLCSICDHCFDIKLWGPGLLETGKPAFDIFFDRGDKP